MKSIPFETATFLKSLLPTELFPPIRNTHGKDLDEIALVGKSNVGKSSLINSLLRKKHLAKTSSVPGKTQHINFFNVDDEVCLVDLPGYGFAQVPKAIKNEWSKSLDFYLKTRKQLKLLIILIDSRRIVSDDDLLIMQWALSYEKPFFIVFTKTDKLSPQQLKTQIEKNVTCIKECLRKDVVYIPFTIESTKSRLDLIKNINQFLS